MGSMRTKEDEVQRISMSVFVTSFPEQSYAKDLWNACMQYGYVVDAFIPNRRSKGGKRFGFVRFIKVFDVERLVSNLCMMWIGKCRIHANVARFQRPNLNNSSKQFSHNGEKRNNMHEDKKDNGPKDNSNSYAHAVKGRLQVNREVDNIPMLVLDESCVNQQDYSCCLNGKVKDFEALSNLKVVLDNDGFDDIVLRYLGGLWVLIEFISVEIKEKFQSNMSNGTWFSQLHQASNDLSIDGRVAWVEIEGIPLKFWSDNTFKWIASKWGTLLSVDDSEEGCLHSKRLCIYMTDFVELNDEDSESGDEYSDGDCKEDLHRSDKELEGENDVTEVPDTVFEKESPRSKGGEDSVGQSDKQSEDPFNIYPLLNKNTCDNNKGSSTNDSLKYPPGFTPGEDVEAEFEKSNKGNSADSENGSNNNWSMKGGTELGVSNHFKKVVPPRIGGSIILLMDGLIKVGQTMGASVGNSGGILSVWDSNSFMKINATILDYFVMVRGEVIVMGDFNEVRNKNERFGSVLNLQGANAFNSFISSAGLEEVPLGGYSFTWCHRSASKMSKLDRFLISKNLMNSCLNFLAITLDRYLSDHCPILLRESKYFYGPIPFHFFHYWIEVDGFEKLVNEAWLEAPVDASNAMLNLMYKLKYLKKKIRAWNGMRKFSKNSKFMLKMELAELELIIDKGDENSKYYHGILNKKRNQLSIRGVLAAGSWIENLVLVKNEFLNHFKNWFERPKKERLILNTDFPCKLTSIQQADMEAEVSNEEIKRAVWDCGIDKSPGPDGFTFGFYRHFWKLIDKDVMAAVKHFFHSGFIPKGVNSSFIALIPKSPDAKMVKEFRPISLIGSLYKIIGKILANRLVMVLGNIVNEVQSAFVADRQILDGPFILNEIFQWFGFGERWRGWIQECLRSSWGSVIVNGSPMEEFQFFKGLKQGDPLSHFLFILIMESLHISFQRVVDAGMFKGIALDSSMQLSLMFYADDAVFVGQWNNLNIDTIVHVLECFHRASGLRINMSKSKIMGIAVNEDRVKQAASKIRCEILKTIVMGKGYQTIHGEDGKIGKHSKAGHASIWRDIVQEMDAFKHHGIDLYSFMQKKLGDGSNTFFWEDVWCENTPRSGVEHSQLVDLLAKIEGVSLGMMNDRWTWTLEGSGVFSVASVRKLIDDRIEVAFRRPEGSSPTRRLMMPYPINAFLSALTCRSEDAEWRLWGAA
ncbi:RNA-directed DNA polymerase, eukaryota [Tanacetum coccineum]